ncbi:TrmH family RNA methyltransferase [Shouchella shacheensis]|uniref:TrmH family RNA methyltransferase n=1 Tax=Shouchella shacheensis TaxID=1649580 RepID=UPI00073FDF93|nr:RNA methyltransferase [Shouchella shacheensis]
MKRIDSAKNEQVKNWKKLHTKKGRQKLERFLIEGDHLVKEALASNVRVETLLFTEKHKSVARNDVQGVLVSDSVMKELTVTENPQGVVAICEPPPSPPVETLAGGYVLLDRLQDPGNVGTIIRTALAAGMSGVVLGSGSVDLFNGKVVRATQGALFHLPVFQGNLKEWILRFQEQDIPLYGTALHDAEPYTIVSRQNSFALVLGNEGEGVDPVLLRQTNQNICIPQNYKTESLNVAVAAGILMYALKK